MANGPDLLNLSMEDGARWFYDAGPGLSMTALARRVSTLPGFESVEYLEAPDGSWLSFTSGGRAYSANDPFGDVWLFAEDPATPEAELWALIDLLFPGTRSPSA